MKNKIPNIYIITCDETIWVTYFTTRLVNKYLKNVNIYILGYNNLVNDYEENVTFVSLGNKRNERTWYQDIYKFFNSIEDEILIMMLDDFPINDSVNLEYLDYCISYLQNNNAALIYCLYLNKSNSNKFIYENDNYLIESQDDHPNIWITSLWRKKCLLELFKTDYSKLETKQWMLKTGNLNDPPDVRQNYINNIVKFEYYAKKIINKKYPKYKFIMIKNKKQKNYNLISIVRHAGLLSRNAHPDNILLLYLKKEDLKIFYDEKAAKYLKYDITFGLYSKNIIRVKTYNEILNNDNFYEDMIQKNHQNDKTARDRLRNQLNLMNIN